MSREHGGVVSRPDVDQLLVREAWLLDHQRLDEWLGLFTDDAVYWAPLQMDQAEPFTTASLIYDDRRLLEIRVRQAQHPRAHARGPAPRTVHQVTNVQVVADDGRSSPSPRRWVWVQPGKDRSRSWGDWPDRAWR